MPLSPFIFSLSSFFFSSPSFSQTCWPLPVLTPTQLIHSNNEQHLFMSREMGQTLEPSSRFKEYYNLVQDAQMEKKPEGHESCPR